MMRQYLFVPLVFLSVAMLAGCALKQHLSESRSPDDSPPFTVTESVAVIDDEIIPGDIRMVTAAVVQEMRRDSMGIPRVTFDTAGSHMIAEDFFNYQGFSVASVVIEEYWYQDLGPTSTLNRLEGLILFKDALGRRALARFIVDYELSRDRIVILNSVVIPQSPLFPVTKAYIIEASDLQTIVSMDLGFPEFYHSVASLAQNMEPTSEERQRREELHRMSLFERMRHTPSAERRDYYMVVFVMDRMLPDDGFEVLVTAALSARDRTSLAEAVYRDVDGWRIAFFGGNFAIDQDVFYAQALYRPARDILPGGLSEVLVGLFATEKNYKEQQHTVEMTTRPSPQPGVQRVGLTPVEGPLASGHVFLNPAKRDDARVIQTRLAELGFYNMAIDGLWGPGSRGALQGFQRSINITANGEWTMQSQMRLFSGTGK